MRISIKFHEFYNDFDGFGILFLKKMFFFKQVFPTDADAPFGSEPMPVVRE